MTTSGKEPVPRAVLEAIERVRKRGLTNMFDRPAVVEILARWDEDTACDWVDRNRDAYSRGVLRGFAPLDD